jgi:hypothetical protein
VGLADRVDVGLGNTHVLPSRALFLRRQIATCLLSNDTIFPYSVSIQRESRVSRISIDAILFLEAIVHSQR